MNMANRAITRTFTDSNCFSYLLSLSLSLQCLVVSLKVSSSSGLSLRAGGRVFSPTTKRVAPGYFYWKIEEK